MGHLAEFLSRWASVHRTATLDVEPTPAEAPPAVAARRPAGLRLWKPH